MGTIAERLKRRLGTTKAGRQPASLSKRSLSAHSGSDSSSVHRKAALCVDSAQLLVWAQTCRIRAGENDMIDDNAKAMKLLEKMKAQLPISARPGRAFLQAMRKNGMPIRSGQECF